MLADQPKQSLRRCLYSIYHPSHKPDPLVVPPSASSSLAIFRYLIGGEQVIRFVIGGGGAKGRCDERGTKHTADTTNNKDFRNATMGHCPFSYFYQHSEYRLCVCLLPGIFLKRLMGVVVRTSAHTNLEGRNKGPPAYKDPSRVAPLRYLRWLSRCLKRIHPSP